MKKEVTSTQEMSMMEKNSRRIMQMNIKHERIACLFVKKLTQIILLQPMKYLAESILQNVLRTLHSERIGPLLKEPL